MNGPLMVFPHVLLLLLKLDVTRLVGGSGLWGAGAQFIATRTTRLVSLLRDEVATAGVKAKHALLT